MPTDFQNLHALATSITGIFKTSAIFSLLASISSSCAYLKARRYTLTKVPSACGINSLIKMLLTVVSNKFELIFSSVKLKKLTSLYLVSVDK